MAFTLRIHLADTHRLRARDPVTKDEFVETCLDIHKDWESADCEEGWPEFQECVGDKDDEPTIRKCAESLEEQVELLL